MLLLGVVSVPYLGITAGSGAAEHGEDDEVSAAADLVGESEYSDFVENATGSQVSLLRFEDDFHTGTATERFARPALSLGKLYIADYVFEHGTVAEGFLAVEMITTSSDDSAAVLYGEYPDSIDATADKYGLLSTRGAERWGYAVTSTYDVVKFIAALLEDDPTSPILVAMAASAAHAEDGYPQDWGTAVLPGVIGTKWGWSDDRKLHSSVSFGDGFVVAAAVTGTAENLTQLVEAQVGEVLEED